VPLQPWLQGHVVIDVFYLHGFASSARSSKALFLGERLRAQGARVHTPDFNEPDFSTLTVTRMIEQVTLGLDREPERAAAIIGSSLGGFVAVQVALQRPEIVRRLVLLAPALDFGGNQMRDLGDRGIDEWRRTDRLEVFHHGYGRVMPVRYELYEDARRYDSFNAQLAMPVQVFQGRRDTAVDPETVRRWADAHAGVELHLLDDDHQLHGSLEYIWDHMQRFLR
jgi:uncharacterized protein